MKSIKAIKGMNDILPSSSYIWFWLEKTINDWLNCYGYQQIRTPLVEPTDLFLHTVGASSDIVNKEMYCWQDDMNGDKLSLRPEGTASCMRAVIEHNLLYNQPQKLWYMGAMFRHERPQQGRYRQFHQLGVEAIGFNSYQAEIELVSMLADLWQRLGLTSIKLHINCLGNSQERLAYKSELQQYFLTQLKILWQQQKITTDQFNDLERKTHTNPLRILDSKITNLESVVKQAPNIFEYLKHESLDHYNSWKQALTDLKIDYIENPYLVRGLDYYNLSVFEWISDDLGSQSAVCGGGRYDALFNLLPNKIISNRQYAAGFAIGLERLIIILTANKLLPTTISYDFYFCYLQSNYSSFVTHIIKLLRSNQKWQIFYNYESIALKNHLKKAQQMKARFCLIIGEQEVQNQTVTVKNMETRTQTSLNSESLLSFLYNQLNENQ